MKRILAAVVVLCASPLAAADINWNTDVLAQFHAQMKEAAASPNPAIPTVAGKAVAQPASENGVQRITGRPISPNTESVGDDFPVKSLTLETNDTKDRVGASLWLCEDPPRDPEFPRSETIKFYFPELKYDAKAKQVLWNGEVVVTFGFWGDKWNKAFKLGYTKTRKVRDLGFDHVTETVYEVYLEKIAK